MHGPKSSYSAEPRAGDGVDDSPYPQEFLAGSKAQLVSGFQTLDNSRILFAGSLDLFSNKFWDVAFDVKDKDVKKLYGHAE